MEPNRIEWQKRCTYGNVYYGIDEDMRDRLQAKLMRAVLDYKID